jgi:LPS O-antigen subunit length determinant protein (WzzB/FepE family)
MKNSKFEYYRSFENEENAKEFTDFLTENEVGFLLDSPEVLIDKSIVGTGFLPKITLKIKSQDFKKVNDLIAAQIEDTDIAAEGDYLNDLNNEELTDILKNPDEWSIEDRIVAKKILVERGITYSDTEISTFKNDKLQQIRAGKKASPLTLILYFLCILVGFYVGIFFTLAGIGMGYYYGYGTSTDINGEKYFAYDKETQRYGKIILYVGLVGFFIQLFLLYRLL